MFYNVNKSAKITKKFVIKKYKTAVYNNLFVNKLKRIYIKKVLLLIFDIYIEYIFIFNPLSPNLLVEVDYLKLNKTRSNIIILL